MTNPLITVQEAEARLAGYAELYPEEVIPLEQATGRILRTAIRADREYPALDRSRMDGIAIAFAAWEMGVRDYPVGGMARAGDPRGRLDDAAGCVEIMTGAPIPIGADTVIPYEALSLRDAVASVSSLPSKGNKGDEDATVAQGQFVHRQGSDCAQGEVLVEVGAKLNAVRIAAAASMGYAQVTVARRPRIAIVTTGDELVGVREIPLEHQIRGSNGPALQSLFQSMGFTSLRSVGDDRSAMHAQLKPSLADSEVLLVTGGVSAGKFDEVPGVLKELGVKEVFHKVAQKPGKPLWFGVGPQGQLVFGLPGNPVSALVCARRYVVPILHTKSGKTAGSAPKLPRQVRFAGANPAPSKLTQFVPVQIRRELVESVAIPCIVNGSGDFSGLGRSDGFVEIPAQINPQGNIEGKAVSSMPAGEILSFFEWES